ncbi:hypothetical protein OG588_13555 [Streptomyces prunicolor]|uniref:hypothetical protein n=1 Tax=Streptomyces prunicolor TaxID=67348 RepID=UPI00386AED10|nr:hypothetical protein OG588_13555 [Streptomyces prunicolor]
MPPTRLPTAAGCTLQDAGLDWDVIRVQRQLGIAAMAVLGARCGAVLEYPPKEVVYYFVASGTAAEWAVEGTQAIGKGGTLTIPPVRRAKGPGPHWRACPEGGDWLTDAHVLRSALEDCLPSRRGSEWSA